MLWSFIIVKSYLYLMYFSMCFYEFIDWNLLYKYGSENKTIDNFFNIRLVFQ